MRTVSHVIFIPGDLFNPGPEWEGRILAYAIDYARDGEDSPFTDWCVPASWGATIIKGDSDSHEVEVRVTRHSNLPKGTDYATHSS